MADDRLELTNLHRHHPGVPETVEGFYAVAAAVCLQRHRSPPGVIDVTLRDKKGSYRADWRPPSDEEERSFGNKTDATCFGAYTVALAAVFAHMGLKAIGRSGTGTGSDWYLVPADAEVEEWYLEVAWRLEVSGSDDLGTSRLHSRIKEKVEQARRGHSRLPAYAAVVSFASATVTFERV
jgi:hypothetical protein